MSEHHVFVSLGSNIDPEHNLIQAVHLLGQQTQIIAYSTVYRTPPQGFTDQADFLNMAVQLQTNKTPEEFKSAVLTGIEQQLKRVRDPLNKNAPRTIDLDIALWDNLSFDYGDKPWHVPDQDILRFAHVAVPLAEIAPDYIHPENGQSLTAIAARFDKAAMQIETLHFDLPKPTIEYRVNPPLDKAGMNALNALYASAWPNHTHTDFDEIDYILSYICAYHAERLIGFVYLAWDGGVHAFLLDTTVHRDYQHQGIGTGLVEQARAEAQRHGLEWLHVDYEPHLDSFYRGCGFEPTLAGLIRLRPPKAKSTTKP